MATALHQRMHQDLQLAGRSEGSQRTCLRAETQLVKHFQTAPDRLSERQADDYFLHLKNDRKFPSSSFGIAYNAIKFFYSRTVLGLATGPLANGSTSSRRGGSQMCALVGEVRQLIDTVRTLHHRFSNANDVWKEHYRRGSFSE
jgi:integrase/recombinase XerD